MGAGVKFPGNCPREQPLGIVTELPGAQLRAQARGGEERWAGYRAVAIENVVHALRKAKRHAHAAPRAPGEQRMPVEQQEDSEVTAMPADELREFGETGEFNAQGFAEG